jgi:hypothetical protein
MRTACTFLKPLLTPNHRAVAGDASAGLRPADFENEHWDKSMYSIKPRRGLLLKGSVLGLLIGLLLAMSCQANSFGLFAQFTPRSDFSSGPPGIFIFFFVLIAVAIIGSIIFSIGKGVTQWSENNEQPVLTVQAKVVAKRADTSVYRRAGNNNLGTTSSTSYFATFEFASSDREEFSLSEREYGLLAENDSGELTFQGTRYKGFTRAETVASAATATASEFQAAKSPSGEESFCPYCGLPVGKEFNYCPKCGKVQPEYISET